MNIKMVIEDLYIEPDRLISNSIIATLGTLSVWFFGEWDATVKVFASFMLLDYITGVIVAFINGKIDSRVGFKGLMKKGLILVVLAMSVLLDRLLGTEWTLRTAVCYFFIGNEGWSILENLGKTGMEKFPKSIKNVLAQLKDEEKTKGGE